METEGQARTAGPGENPGRYADLVARAEGTGRYAPFHSDRIAREALARLAVMAASAGIGLWGLWSLGLQSRSWIAVVAVAGAGLLFELTATVLRLRARLRAYEELRRDFPHGPPGPADRERT